MSGPFGQTLYLQYELDMHVPAQINSYSTNLLRCKVGGIDDSDMGASLRKQSGGPGYLPFRRSDLVVRIFGFIILLPRSGAATACIV